MGSVVGTIIAIIVIIVSVVRALSALTGNNDQNKAGPRRERPRRSLEDWDQIQAQRRAEMAQRDRPDIQAQTGADPSQMTMAQRIELARQRARQQGGGVSQADAHAHAQALRQAHERAELEAQRRRQSAEQAQRQHAEQARLEQQRQEAQRRVEREQTHQRELQKSRARQQVKQPTRQPVGKRRRPPAVPETKTQPARSESYQRVHVGHAHIKPPVITRLKRGGRSATKLGPLTVASLRRAIVMKELLDPPIALRNPQDAAF